ncbi:MAG: hypothetical protein ACLFPN_01690, partial [Methanomassiliicoccales archaeon]
EELRGDFKRLKEEGSRSISKVDDLEISPSKISDRFTKGVAPETSSVRTKVVRKMTKEPSMIVNGEFEIPGDHLEMFEGVEDGQPFMMVGDTDSWVLSLTFLASDIELVEVGFVIPDRPGAIHEITDALAMHSINLLSVWTKVLVYYEKMTMLVVADVSRCPLSNEELREDLKGFTESMRGNYRLESFEPIDF